jgi:hypothetical protein
MYAMVFLEEVAGHHDERHFVRQKEQKKRAFMRDIQQIDKECEDSQSRKEPWANTNA